jgi:peptidoglycan/LPS O-acetylase OafA/YrhL
MLISIANAPLENGIFFAILLAALLIPGRNTSDDQVPLPLSRTLELKGFAILTVLLGHIGYFLSSNHDFLFPLSTISGVGVDIFLLLSGYGLTASGLRRTRAPKEFYLRHAAKLYQPLWIILGILFTADFFLLGKSYGLPYMLRSFLGIFPTADLYSDVNSPLWYFMFTVFLYLIFPIVFRKKRVWLSALIMTALTGSLIVIGNHFFLGSVVHLYDLHFLAFPLGMLLASLFSSTGKAEFFLSRIKLLPFGIRSIMLAVLTLLVWQLSLHTNVPGLEQAVSLIIVALLLGFFLIKKSRSLFLTLMGTYSFEIYLFHWPILYRYDFLYRVLPAGIATALYLAFFILLGYLFDKALRSHAPGARPTNSV